MKCQMSKAKVQRKSKFQMTGSGEDFAVELFVIDLTFELLGFKSEFLIAEISGACSHDG